MVALVFLTAFPGFGASIVNAVGGGTFFFAGKSADERFERVRLLRVAVAGESSEREDVAWERRLTAGEFTPAISLDVSAGRAERFIGPFEAFEKEVVWLPGAIEKRADWRNGRREFLIDSSRPSLLSSKNCDSIG